MELEKIRALIKTLDEELKHVTNLQVLRAGQRVVSDLSAYCKCVGDGSRILDLKMGKTFKGEFERILQNLQIFSELLKKNQESKSLSERIAAQMDEIKQLLKIHRLVLGEACKKKRNGEMSIAEMAARFLGQVHGFRKMPRMLIKDLTTYQIAQGGGRAIPPALLHGRFGQFSSFEKRQRIDCILTGGSDPTIIYSSDKNELPGRLMELTHKSASLERLAAKLVSKDLSALSIAVKRYCDGIKKAMISGLTSDIKNEINQSLAAVRAELRHVLDESGKRVAGYQAAGGRSKVEIKAPTDDDIRHFLSVQGAYLDHLIQNEGLLSDRAKELDRLAGEVLDILESFHPAKKTLELKLKNIDRRINDFHGAQLELSREIGSWGYNPLFWLTQKITDFRDTVQYMLQSNDFSRKAKDGLRDQMNGIGELYNKYIGFCNSEMKKNPELELSVALAHVKRTAEELKSFVYDMGFAVCDYQPTATPLNYMKRASGGAGSGMTAFAVCDTGALRKVQK